MPFFFRGTREQVPPGRASLDSFPIIILFYAMGPFQVLRRHGFNEFKFYNFNRLEPRTFSINKSYLNREHFQLIKVICYP